MKNSILIISFLISSALMAQTKVSVTVQNFSFSPASITVNVGDTVEWTNVGGSHNVNGTQATHPSNPASFGNAVAPAGWIYFFVFATAGTYDYHCNPHVPNMAGQVIVQLATGVEEKVELNEISFYPNPASKKLNFSEYKSVQNVIIYSITGEQVINSELINNKLDISTLNAGTYFVKVITNKGETTQQKLIIQ